MPGTPLLPELPLVPWGVGVTAPIGAESESALLLQLVSDDAKATASAARTMSLIIVSLAICGASKQRTCRGQ